MDIPECFYRVSAKALVLNETRDKFLIIQDENGWWDLPGGGLEWETTPQIDIPREVTEEMSLKVTSVSDNPSYFYTDRKPSLVTKGAINPYAYVLYETVLENLDFKASDECVRIMFVNKQCLPEDNVHQQVLKLAKIFNQ